MSYRDLVKAVRTFADAYLHTSEPWEAFGEMTVQLLRCEKNIAESDAARVIDGEVTPEKMMGDTQCERELNAYLTKQFILPRDVPSDECLSEAREVIELVRKHDGAGRRES